MGVEVAIAGTTRTSATQMKSISITNSVRAKGSVATLEAVSTDGSAWRPRAGNEIIISTTSDAVRHFAGIITNVIEEPRNLLQLHYTLDCKDYTWLLDRRLVATTYGASAASAMVADIINTYTTGFTTGGIDAAPSVAAQRFDYVPPSEAITALANQIQWHWYVDYSKVLQFFSAITDVAPTTAINFDTNTTTYGSMRLEESAENIRNRIILQGYKVATSVQFNQQRLMDGQSRFIGIGYEPVDTSTGNITATLDGQSLAIATDVVDAEPGTTQGTSSSLYVCFTNMGVRFSSGFAVPSSSMVLSVTFNYLRDGGIQHDDGSAQTEMASRSSGDGIHMYSLSDPNLSNRASNDDLAIAVGAAMTAQYGKPTLNGTFISYTNGWRAGQYFTGLSTDRMGGFNKTLYVYGVTKRIISHPSGGSPTWEHQVSISDVPQLT